MAKFNPQTFDVNKINSGERFVAGDSVTPEAINAPIEASAFMQSLATNAPDVSEIDGVGIPSVEIVRGNFGARFKIKNLRGKQGEQGEKGDSGLAEGATLSNEYGESDENGYTQKYINEHLSGGGGYNPNLLINPDFTIMQREIPYVSGGDTLYYVDRWIAKSAYSISKGEITNGIPLSFTSYYAGGGIYQIVPNIGRYGDTDFTFSAMLSSNSGSEEIQICLISTDENEGFYESNRKTIVINSTPQVYTITGKANYKSNLIVEISTKYAQKSFNAYWAKLEIGNKATEFIAPDPVEELVKCKRYFQYINKKQIASPIFLAKDGLVSIKAFFPEMRKAPTVYSEYELGGFQLGIQYKQNNTDTEYTGYDVLNSYNRISASTNSVEIFANTENNNWGSLCVLDDVSDYEFNFACDAEIHSYTYENSGE